MVGRAALISALRVLLKTKAPAEISRQEIAAAAGVDPTLVSYYFGNKDGILTEVTAEISREMHARLAKAVEAGTTCTEKLINRTRAFLAMHAENPHLNELFIQQILYGTRAAAARARTEIIADSVTSLTEIIEDGVRRGEFRPVDARLLHIALIGMYDFFFTGRPVVEEIFGASAFTPRLTAAYGDFLCDLLMHGIGVGKPTARAKTPARVGRAGKVAAKPGATLPLEAAAEQD